MPMKIIFICSDQTINKGEVYTPECELFVSIKSAAARIDELGNVIQAIDIADLTDIEDVTIQIAKVYLQDMCDNGTWTEDLPTEVMDNDMSDFIAILAEQEAEETGYQQQIRSDYASNHQ